MGLPRCRASKIWLCRALDSDHPGLCWCGHFSVIFNGKMDGYFEASRGLRQGDPLSPSLSILAEDVLSRALNCRLVLEDEYATTIARCPSHLLFADDIILFVRARRTSILRMMEIVDSYAKCSGQRLNDAKCKFFQQPSASLERVRAVKSATHFE